MDQLKVKDRILENISLSVKKLQSYFAACEDETPAIRNHDRVLQRLCEHLDHALLYGLQDISSGYWVLVLHFTRKEAVRQIDELQHIATNLGRSRAWLYLALSESSLESYLRLFQENQALLQKYYFKNALVCSHDHLTLFLTLVSGLEFIRFDLELDVPYLDVAPYMPEYYKPHNLLDFEERLPSSDSLSLHSFTSLTSTNLEWDDSAIAPSSEDYDFGDIFPVLQSLPSADWEEGDLTDQASCPRSSGSDPQTVISDTVVLSSGALRMKVTSHLAPHSPTLRHNPFNEDSDTNTSADVTPVHVASRHNSFTAGEDTEGTGNELEVIRMARRRKPAKKRRGRGSTDSLSSIHNSVSSEHMELDHHHLPSEDMTDTSMDTVGQSLRDVVDRINGTLDREDVWEHREETDKEKSSKGSERDPEPPSQQPFREASEGEPPDPTYAALPLTVQALLPRVVATMTLQSIVSRRIFQMLRMSTGHMEGDLQPLYLLLTDCYIYLLRKGAAEKPYTVEDAVSYNEMDYLSVGLDQQTVMVVCNNRRRKFLLDTADASLTLCFLSILKSAMVKGCREPPYPSVLTDATMEKLALTKFVSQESHCEAYEVSIQLYSLVHWEDPMDMTLSPQGGPPSAGRPASIKEGSLQYRSGTTYLGKELWKSCYLVLSKGILYLYAERTDVTPVLSVTMGGEHCGGCRRSNSTERPHAFQVILTERPSLELIANNEQDMSEWMLLLCQSVSKGVIPQGVAPTPCIPCCLVMTDRKLLTCHQDCQTSFFRSLGSADICDVTAVSVETDKEYCVIEFASDRTQFLPPWVLYFSGCEERDRLMEVLSTTWKAIFQLNPHVCPLHTQVDLPHREVVDPSVQKRCREALALMHSAWQRADSLARGRAQREPWC
ncbi:Pleckstrin like domain containing family M member 2 [Dissostichus eleginoides]|uniref:Pleckstrin homology domain-containing family M member 2 n=1 Tax=Dissostichus eleginoides TaxID=100907 RepID=A0AAD9CBS9_DISEL|nr:Pleckstrin like domain containing family M member 2 [Dissostichus eleginoides]